MEIFKNIKSTVVPINIENIDTDQIIPARFLKNNTREGFGMKLFQDWRYDDQNRIRPDFVLNKPAYRGSILVTGKNFGCGSSREHAVWAIYDYGFRVIISSYFGDIFKNNALNYGLLVIQVSQKFLNTIFDAISENNHLELNIDLENQIVEIYGTEYLERFEIDQFKKNCFLNGHNNMDFLLSIKDKIEEYEKKSIYLKLMNANEPIIVENINSL